MENKIYTFNVDGKNFFVSTEEINAIYDRQYGLTEKDIEKYAARYVAQLKNYRECPKWLDKELVLRLIGEERLMKNGEADGFKLQLTFAWYVELKKENLNPFKYTINAYCLDNIQTFARRYPTIQAALLHCLNGFNENTSISNRYKSIEHYLCSDFQQQWS